MKILVVEDARDMNRLIEKTLKRAGYSVDSCFDGEEALNYLLGAEYDAILLDVMMPKLDGYSVLKQLRDRDVDTPVLLLTAKDAVSDRVKGLDLGADDYLIKPFAFDELLARISFPSTIWWWTSSGAPFTGAGWKSPFCPRNLPFWNT